MKEEQKVDQAKPRVPKTFARIYYTVLALAAALLLIFSFVTYYYAGASEATSVDVQSAHANYAVDLAQGERNVYASASSQTVDKIDGWLGSINGLARAAAAKADDTVDKTDPDESGSQKITAAYQAGVPTYTVQDFAALDMTLDLDTVGDMTAQDDAGKEGFVYAGRQVKNFVVIIPGAAKADNNDAVLFMTHYDSNFGSAGASSASAVAAMIGTIDRLVASGAKADNDLVFVITDGRYESSVGAYAFKNQFVGFDNVYSRVKAAFNFDAVTAGGALSIVQTSDADSGVMSGYLASGASVRTDSSVAALMDGHLSSDFDIFYDKHNDVWDVPALNFMTTAGAYDAGTKYDTTENVGQRITAQYASAMEGLAGYFGNADLGALASGVDAAAYTYLGLGAGVPGAVVYVMAAILLVLLLANGFLAVRKKTFGLENAFKGLGGVLLALAVSLGAFFIAYFLIGLLAVAFGTVTLNMLVGAHLLTPAVLFPAILLAAAVSCGLYPLIKRGFKIKAGDCVRGGAILQMLVAVGFGFIFPAGALPFLIVGLVNAFVMILSSLIKDVFRKKFGFGIDRLFLYTLPAMFGLPFLIQATLTIGNLFATISMPFMLIAVGLLLASITPYFDYLQPALKDAFEKLPKHTIPVVETVVEEREDPVKKGKFETVTETKVVKRKIPWVYHNWFGVTFICVLTIVALIIAAPISAGVNADMSKNFMPAYDYTDTRITDSIYDDAIVCYVDGSISSTGRYYWLIKDEGVYQEIKYLKGYDYWEWTWDETLGAYKKEVNTSNMPSYSGAGENSSGLFERNKADGSDVYEIEVTPTYSQTSQVVMTISGAKSGDVLSLTKSGRDEADYALKFDNPAGDVEIALPYGYGSCTVSIKSSSSSIIVNGYEYNTQPLALNYAYEQFADIQAFFTERGKDIRVAFLLKDTA